MQTTDLSSAQSNQGLHYLPVDFAASIMLLIHRHENRNKRKEPNHMRKEGLDQLAH